MEDIFKNLSSLCDPHPISSIRGNAKGRAVDNEDQRKRAVIRQGSDVTLETWVATKQIAMEVEE